MRVLNTWLCYIVLMTVAGAGAVLIFLLMKPESIPPRLNLNANVHNTSQNYQSADLSVHNFVLLSKSYLAINQNDFTRAAELLAEALETQPKHLTLISTMAQVQNMLNDVVAEHYFSKWIDLESNNPFAFGSRGFVRLRLGKTLEAKDDFVMALQYNPSAEVRQNIESALERMEMDSREEELLTFQRAVEESTNTQDWNELENLWSRHIELYPDNAFAFGSRGFVRLRLGKTLEAKDDFAMALQYNPSAELQQNIESALAQIEIDHREEEFLAFQRTAVELATRQDWDALSTHYDIFLEKYPNNVFVTASRGMLRLQQRRFEEAMSDLRFALEMNPDPILKNAIEIEIVNAEATLSSIRNLYGIAPGENVSQDVWMAADIIELIATNYTLENYTEVRSYLARLEGLDKTEIQTGMYKYFMGEMRLRDGVNSGAHRYFLSASELLPSNFYRSEALWKVANYYREREVKRRREPAEVPTLTRGGLFNRITGMKLNQFTGESDSYARRAGVYAQLAADILPDNEVRNLQVAYLFLDLENDRMASHYFERAVNSVDLGPKDAHIYLDMAYVYMRQRNSRQLRRSLDNFITLATERNRRNRIEGNSTREQVEQLYRGRRFHADITRRWGMYSGLYSVLYDNGDYAIQGINDFYWQPLNSNGRYLQLYWQVTDTFTGRFSSPITLADGVVYHVGRTNAQKSLYTTVGARFDLSEKYNLVTSFERLIKIGEHTTHDTRVRVGHSWDTGQELEPWVKSWKYRTTFHEVIYSIQHDNWFFNGTLRAGRSHRLDAVNNRLVFTPYATLSYGYQDRGLKFARSLYMEGGGGILLRRWYRENSHNAPRSYLDVVLEYKAGLSQTRNDSLLFTVFHAF